MGIPSEKLREDALGLALDDRCRTYHCLCCVLAGSMCRRLHEIEAGDLDGNRYVGGDIDRDIVLGVGRSARCKRTSGKTPFIAMGCESSATTPLKLRYKIHLRISQDFIGAAHDSSEERVICRHTGALSASRRILSICSSENRVFFMVP
jgi:hypothetical protein